MGFHYMFPLQFYDLVKFDDLDLTVILYVLFNSLIQLLQKYLAFQEQLRKSMMMNSHNDSMERANELAETSFRYIFSIYKRS